MLINVLLLLYVGRQRQFTRVQWQRSRHVVSSWTRQLVTH